MFGIHRKVIAQHERALVFVNGMFGKILGPGVHWTFAPFKRVAFVVYDLTVPEFQHHIEDFLVGDAPELTAEYFQVVELGDYEVALVYKNGKLHTLLTPGTRQFYWRGPVDITVEVVNIEKDFEIPRDKAVLLGRERPREALIRMASAVYAAEVADQHVGLLIVDGELVKVLDPGPHTYWKFNRNVKIEQFDTRIQAMDVGGQEILTKDKVTLRVNLTAAYKVVDPVKARQDLVDVPGHLYRELQFALRAAIGTRTLDTLLGNKGELDRVIYEAVAPKVAAHGVEVDNVGVKDVILPGEMKNILNQVVEADKAAQANVIKRREETAATRALLNTARLMDENPTLLRLKELEMLEKVTEKVDKLTVFGGLDGVLNDTVKINVRGDG